jgi:hypothetical protein
VYRRVSDVFAAAAGKTLSAVEVNPTKSNQHEFNGVAELVRILGDPVDRERFDAMFVYLDDDLEPVVDGSSLTWYDARRKAREERGVNRSELRLYYPSNEVMSRAGAGDLLVIAREHETEGGRVLVAVCEGGSSVALQMSLIFGLSQDTSIFEVDGDLDRQLDFTTAVLLEALGYETSAIDTAFLGQLLTAFGEAFPTTKTFSEFARLSADLADPTGDPDGALLAWMTREEVLFRTLERHIVARDLEAAEGEVERVLEVAQQAFQRRKARAGQALENHLEHLFGLLGVSNTRGGKTEGAKKPDFIFPSVDAYHDPDRSPSRICVLGVKTTCKDRWRQVLNEADRVPSKHLLTLEAPISSAQLNEMTSAGLSLVVPSSLHSLFAVEDQTRIMSVSAFVELVKRL